jgi:hypothetical protein
MNLKGNDLRFRSVDHIAQGYGLRFRSVDEPTRRNYTKYTFLTLLPHLCL